MALHRRYQSGKGHENKYSRTAAKGAPHPRRVPQGVEGHASPACASGAASLALGLQVVQVDAKPVRVHGRQPEGSVFVTLPENGLDLGQ